MFKLNKINLYNQWLYNNMGKRKHALTYEKAHNYLINTVVSNVSKPTITH